MNNSKKVLVIDSYLSEHYARVLQMGYGETAIVKPLLRNINETSEMDRIIKNDKSVLDEVTLEENAKDRFDLLFVSGMLINDKFVNVQDLKEKYGNDNVKVVVFSTMSSYLNVSGVDYRFEKSKLEIKPTDEVKDELLSFLN